MQVLATGNFAAPPLGWRNSRDGWGEKPIGGTASDPVANARMSPNFFDPSSSVEQAGQHRIKHRTQTTFQDFVGVEDKYEWETDQIL